MSPELIAHYDAAVQALEAFAEVAVEDPESISARLARDVADAQRHDSRSWFPRWVLSPLGAVRAFEELHRRVIETLGEVRDETARLEAQIDGLRREGREAEAKPLAQRRLELMRHQASLSVRLEARREARVAAARRGVARTLEASLSFAAQEAAEHARQALGESCARVHRVLGQLETYARLSRQAAEITGGLDLPRFRAEDVALIRSAARLSSVRLDGVGVSTVPIRPRHAWTLEAKAPSAGPARLRSA